MNKTYTLKIRDTNRGLERLIKIREGDYFYESRIWGRFFTASNSPNWNIYNPSYFWEYRDESTTGELSL